MDDERQKKILAGKLKLAEFKKRRNKNSKCSNFSESPVSSIDEKSVPDDPGGKSEQDRSLELNSSVKDNVDHSSYQDMMDDNISVAILSPFSEGSDDLVPFLNAEETEIVSLYDEKIRKYQDAIQQRDIIIQQLSSRLESAMNVNQAADSAGNMKIEELKQEINVLHLQMKETAEMFEKQKSKVEIPDLIIEGKLHQTALNDLKGETKHEAGIQVDTKEISEFTNSNEASAFESFISNFCETYDSSCDITSHLSNTLKKNFSHSQIQELIKLLRQNSDSYEAVENVLHSADFRNSSCIESKKCHLVDKPDTQTVLKKMVSLNVVSKLIETLISTSSNNISDCVADFSPSKFQSFFLQHLNCGDNDALPDTSENESQIADINYAEVAMEGDMLFAESPLVLSSVEKLRNKNLMDDFSLVTEYLHDEMERAYNSFTLTSIGPQGDNSLKFIEASYGKSDSKIVTNEVMENIEVDTDIHRIMFNKSKLESRLRYFKQLEKELQNVEQNVRQRSVESDTLTNSEDNLLMEEPPLSCVSLLSLTDSEYRTECVTTDSETNFSRKVSIDIARPIQEREVCIKCEKYVEQVKEKCDNDMIALKESLENFYNNQKTEYIDCIKKLDSEISKLKLEKEDLLMQMNKQIELLCKENEMKIQHLSKEHDEELSKFVKNEYEAQENEQIIKIEELEEKLSQSNKKILELLDEKAKNEYSLQNQIADLIHEHQEDLQTLKANSERQLNEEKKTVRK